MKSQLLLLAIFILILANVWGHPLTEHFGMKEGEEKSPEDAEDRGNQRARYIGGTWCPHGKTSPRCIPRYASDGFWNCVEHPEYHKKYPIYCGGPIESLEANPLMSYY